MTAKLCTTKEIAVRYAIHPKTVQKWVKARILPVVKINRRCIRFDINACDEALNRRTRITAN